MEVFMNFQTRTWLSRGVKGYSDQRLYEKIAIVFFLWVTILFNVSPSCAASRYIGEIEETPIKYYQSNGYYTSKVGFDRCINSSVKNLTVTTPCKNQNPLGTCVSFACVACGEYYYPHETFSEAEFTVLAETMIDGEDCKSGLFLGNALSLAKDYGFVSSERLGYSEYLKYVARKNKIDVSQRDWKEQLGNIDDEDKADICSPDYNTTMREIGKSLKLYGDHRDYTSYTIEGIYPIHHVSSANLKDSISYGGRRVYKESGSIGSPLNADIESVKGALCQGYPVATALRVFDDCWKDSGKITMPDIERNKDIGSHAVVITGFNNTKKVFNIKNSWGTDRGINGFYEAPYDYIRQYSIELTAVIKRS